MAALDKPRSIDYKGKADLVTESVSLSTSLFYYFIVDFKTNCLVNYSVGMQWMQLIWSQDTCISRHTITRGDATLLLGN